MRVDLRRGMKSAIIRDNGRQIIPRIRWLMAHGTHGERRFPHSRHGLRRPHPARSANRCQNQFRGFETEQILGQAILQMIGMDALKNGLTLSNGARITSGNLINVEAAAVTRIYTRVQEEGLVNVVVATD